MLGVGHPAIWIIAVVFAIALGAAIGMFNGVLIAYGQIPSFIVTLGGLIAFSGGAFLIASGVTVAPMDKTFKLIGGNGPLASIGPMWSWVLAAVACIAIGIAVSSSRRQRLRFKFAPKPVWAEVLTTRRRLRRGARHHRDRQCLPLAAARRRALRAREQHPDSARRRGPDRPRHLHGRRQGGELRRWPQLPDRLSDPGADHPGGRRRHDLHRHGARASAATSLRPAATRKPPSLPASTPSG